MNTINQTLFTASVTDGVPPRLAVEFGQGNSFQKDGMPCPAKVAVNATRKITVHLGNKTVVNNEAGDLTSANYCGKSLVLRQASQNSYDYVHDNEDAEGVNLSQVTLQIQGVSLMAKFEAGGAAGPVVPVMTGAGAPVPVGQSVGGVNVPANVQPAVAVAPTHAAPVPTGVWSFLNTAPQSPASGADWSFLNKPTSAAPSQPTTPPYNKLKGDVPQESWRLNRLAGTSYDDYLWYKNNPNPPTDPQKKAAYDRQYPIFLREEALYAALQEKLTAIAAHNRLTFIIPEGQISNFVPYRDYGLSYDLYRGRESMVPPTDTYQKLLQAERDYLTQQARNEYNSAS